jgi:hypothetical protein
MPVKRQFGRLVHRAACLPRIRKPRILGEFLVCQRLQERQ